MANPESSSSHPEIITGLFGTRDDAECAYRCAIDLGYEKSDINLVMADETRQRHFPSGDERAASDSMRPTDTELSDKAATDQAPRLASIR